MWCTLLLSLAISATGAGIPVQSGCADKLCSWGQTEGTSHPWGLQLIPEFGAALAGDVVACGAGLGLMYAGPFLNVVGAACIVLSPTAAAIGVHIVSSRLAPGGSDLALAGCAYLGCFAGGVLGALISGFQEENLGTGALGALLGGSAGAVIGYNLFHDRGPDDSWQRRIGLPSVALTLNRTAAGARLGLRTQLLCYHF